MNLIEPKILNKGDGLMGKSLIDFFLSRLFLCPNLSVSCCPGKGCQSCLIHSINICSCRKNNSLIYHILQTHVNSGHLMGCSEADPHNSPISASSAFLGLICDQEVFYGKKKGKERI